MSKIFQANKKRKAQKGFRKLNDKENPLDVLRALGGYEGDRFYIRSIQFTYLKKKIGKGFLLQKKKKHQGI